MPDGINPNTANIDHLSKLQQRMDNDNFASGELGNEQFANGESKVTQQLYARKGDMSRYGRVVAKKHQLLTRWRMQRGKAATKKILTKYVGSAAAQRAVNNGARGYQNNSRVGLSKAGLGQTIKDAHYDKLTQSCDSMTNSKRQELYNKLDDDRGFVDSWRDPELGPLFKLQAKGDIAAENFAFLEQCHDYKQLLQEYDQLASKQPPNQQALDTKLGQIRNKAAEIGERIVNDDSINVGSKSKDALREMDFANLNIDQLKGLSKEGRSSRSHGPLFKAEKNMRQTAGDVKTRLLSALSPRGNGLDQLKALHGKMGNDDHLRGTESTIYIKHSHSSGINKRWNHAKTHFWGGKRVGKFNHAKNSVQKQVADILGGDKAAKSQAARIMAPYTMQSGALTKAQLAEIISAVEQKLGIDNQLQTLATGGNGSVPNFDTVVSTKPNGWTNAFADYCDLQGSPELKSVKNECGQINRLVDNLDDVQPDNYGQDMAMFGQNMRRENNQGFQHSKLRAQNFLDTHGKSNLPKDLRKNLEAFVKLDRPPGDSRLTDQLRSQLKMHRAELVGNLKPQVQKHWNGFYDAASKANNRAINARNHQQQVQRLQPQQSDNGRDISDNVSVNSDVPHWDNLENTPVNQNQLRNEIGNLLAAQLQTSNSNVSRDSQAFEDALDRFTSLFQTLPNPQNLGELQKLFDGLLQSPTAQSILMRAASDYDEEVNKDEIQSQQSDYDIVNEMNTPNGNNLGNVDLPPQPTVQFNRFESVQAGRVAIDLYLDSSGQQISEEQHKAIQNKISEAEIAHAMGRTSDSLDLIQEAHSMAIHAVSLAINPEAIDRMDVNRSALPNETPGNIVTPGNEE